MKRHKIKSYKTIFLFETFILLMLILNCFYSDLLRVYKLPIFLLIMDFVFFLILGFEKDNKRLKKLISFELFMCSVIFLILYYLSGILFGFVENNNYLTLYGSTMFIIPLILTIVFKEHLRNSLLTKCDNNIYLIIYTVLIFIMIDISSTLSILNFTSFHDVFIFIALTLLPSITINILATYINIKAGFKPMIIYLLILTLYEYVMPFVPAPNEYLKSIIYVLLPVIVLFRVIKVSSKYSDDEEYLSRNYNKKSIFILLVIPILITSFLVYFVSGYFKYYAIAIASGSMRPEFDRGSVVVIERIDKKYDNYDEIKKGEIIAFRIEDKVVVHRLVNIVKVDDETFYYTKGDANKKIDNYTVEKSDIIGIVKIKVPYIGYPTVWLSEL